MSKMQVNNKFEERILARINNEIGSDFKKLHRASLLVDEYKSRLETLREKLSYEEPNNISSFKSAFECEQHTCDTIDFQMAKLQEFGKKLVERISESNKALNAVKPDLEQVRKLQQLVQYLRIVQDIQEISNALTQCINGKDESKMINLYLNLYEEGDYDHSVVGRLTSVEAPFLKTFATQTAIHWHSLLKERFSKEFENVLKSLKWGQKEHDSLLIKPSADNITKAQLLAEYLFLLKSPAEETEQLEMIAPSIICQPLSTVTKYLVAPYRQRFMYHFTGVKQTNRLDKPEWFYTQILNWGKETHLFVGKTFQTSAVKAGKLDFNIRLEFMRGLVQLTIEKLIADIEEISRDENLFAHLLDETLAFEAELRENFGYPASFPSAICVITQPVYLLKWISLEERFCSEKMDMILQAENPWLLIDPNIYDDDLKIPKCADQFIRLLEAIKDRYYSLIQPGHQLQFLSLQLELIDNFRRRLVQLHSSGMVESIPILNAINYIKMVLSEWGENVHYLHLHAALVGPNADEINSVFENPVSELEHWTEKLLKNLATKAVNEIKAKSMPYRHDCWPTMPDQNNKEPFILSPSAGEMFQVMVTVLHNLERELSSNLFNLTLRLIAQQIDAYILDSMIMNTKFSPAGAAQFNYDMTRNLFALFGQYCRRPDLLFKRIHDANKLLNCALGTAMLLHETLQSEETSLEEKMKSLKELGIVNFKPKTCVEVLERRIDIRAF
ncbi:RINT1-like protein isoform X2 [Musca domestica]|nr:RINT1-like protein [Musca domestica]XP_005176931.1 RINT1-like protein [Musca domestica]XP_058987871.1 RINT1-like protein isoform X2 [Musca domestica]